MACPAIGVDKLLGNTTQIMRRFVAGQALTMVLIDRAPRRILRADPAQLPADNSSLSRRHQ
jgi:hypothetical protein